MKTQSTAASESAMPSAVNVARKFPLSSRERVQRAFNRQDQDRVPRYESFWEDTVKRWSGEGLRTDRQSGALEALDTLQADMRSLGWYWPEAFRGTEEIIEQDEETKVVRTANGAILRYFLNKTSTPEHVDWECKEPDIWHDKYRAAIVDQEVQIDIDGAREAYRIGRERDQWCFYPTVESFECLRAMVGDEHFLMAMVEEPEWIQDMARCLTDNVLRNLDALLAAGIEFDGLWVYGDMAFNKGTFCSPQMYRELIWPQHKRFADWAHEHGMKMIYHTDGNVNDVIPLYLEAGFDSLQPLEAKANMDIRELCPQYGDQLTFFGNIDVMVLAFGSLDDIEAEIEAKITAGKATQSYICHSDHTIPPQVSWERFQQIIGLIDKYGQY